MTLEAILGWWNLIFLAPFFVALVYLGVYAASGITFGEADTDGDIGVDADADADVDADADADTDTDADADADADAEVGAEHASLHFDQSLTHATAGHEVPSYLAAFTWLGIGKVPVSLVLMVLLLLWGSIGFITNVLARSAVAEAWQTSFLSLPLAAMGSLLLTRGITQLIVRYFPLNETFARRRHELLGLVGEAIFNIDHDSGVVVVRDDHGHLFQVPCRVQSQRPLIPKGTRVKLVAYNAPLKLYYGVAYDAAREDLQAQA